MSRKLFSGLGLCIAILALSWALRGGGRGASLAEGAADKDASRRPATEARMGRLERGPHQGSRFSRSNGREAGNSGPGVAAAGQVGGNGDGSSNEALPAEVRGRVLTPEGQAAVGALVTSVRPEKSPAGTSHAASSAVADAQGAFVLTLPSGANGRPMLRASADGYRHSRVEAVSLEGRGDAPVPEVVLRLRASHFLAGTIRDTEGKAAPGTTVTATGWEAGDDSLESAVAGADGRYRIEGLSELTHYVGLASPKYGDEAGGETTVDRTDADFVVGASRQKQFIGMLVDWKTGEAVRRFTVTVMKYDYLSIEELRDQPGAFRLDEVPSQGVTLWIEAPGYASIQWGPVRLFPNQNTRTEIIELGLPATVTGRVVNAATGEPAAGVDVVIPMASGQTDPDSPQFGQGRTDPDGKFRFVCGQRGHHRILCRPQAPLVSLPKVISVEYGGNTDAGTLEVYPGATLQGRIVGRPAEESGPILLSLHNERHEVKLEADGGYQLQNLLPGEVQIRLGRRMTATLTLKAGIQSEFSFDYGTATLEGRVLKDGKPSSGEISLSQRIGEAEIAYFASASLEGVYRIPHLREGSWTLRLNRIQQTEVPHQETLTIFAGEHLRRDLTP